MSDSTVAAALAVGSWPLGAWRKQRSFDGSGRSPPRASRRPNRTMSLVGTAAAGDGEVFTADHGLAGPKNITAQIYSMVRGFDPVLFSASGSTGGAELVSVFDSLMTYDSESDTFVPRVAQSATPNHDFTEWTVVIRHGVTFGDGTPLTSKDVVAHYERIRDGAFTYTGLVKSTVSAIEAVDDLTVKFTLTKPWARFPWLLASGAGADRELGVAGPAGRQLCHKVPAGAGVGPYIVKRICSG